MLSAIPIFPDFSVSEHVVRVPHRHGPLFRKWLIDHGRIVVFTTGKFKTGADKDVVPKQCRNLRQPPVGVDHEGGDDVTMWSSFCVLSFTKSPLLDSPGLVRELTADKNGRMNSRILFDQLRIGAYLERH